MLRGFTELHALMLLNGCCGTPLLRGKLPNLDFQCLDEQVKAQVIANYSPHFEASLSSSDTHTPPSITHH